MMFEIFQDGCINIVDLRTDMVRGNCAGQLYINWVEENRPMVNIFGYQTRVERRQAMALLFEFAAKVVFPFADV